MINLIACPYCLYRKIDNKKNKGYCELSKDVYPHAETKGCIDYKSIFVNIENIKIDKK